MRFCWTPTVCSLRSTALLAALALSIAGAACSAEAGGGGPAEPTVPGLSVEVEPLDGPLSSRFDLDGVELWVGSEDVPTQRLLGYIAIEALASVGADAHDRVGIGGGLLTRESLLSGEIDLYWERLGTAWTGFLREAEVPDERDELYRMVATRDLEENGVVWLTPANFSDGQGFAMAPEFADVLEIDNLTDMGDYLSEGMPAAVCVTSEFMTFPIEGRVDFEDALGAVPDDVFRTYDPEPVYPATADGTCTFGLIERVNGRVAEYDLWVLDDDIALFGFDNPAVNVREDVYRENPELGPLFALVADALDEPTVQRLNERIEVGGEDPRTVARDWLVDEGFIEE
jgi:osmoprotectant transport system substrate-binding protein